MCKKMILSIMAMVFAVSSVSIALAEDEGGNTRKGKYLYRKIYKACNERGEISSPTPALNPDAKTQAQWKKIFDTKDFAEFKCKTEWDTLKSEEIQNIYTYLYEHAADSPTPAKCK